jgi:transcriptional regulator with XRE-family HTH domain
MTQADEPTAAIARQVRQLRSARGWSGRQLAERMTDEGIAWDRSIVANLENGRRRTVSVDEWLALALVLDVAPLHLLVPVEGGDYAVTPQTSADIRTVRSWVRGYESELSKSEQFLRHQPRDEQGDPIERLSETVAHVAAELERLKAERPDVFTDEHGDR